MNWNYTRSVLRLSTIAFGRYVEKSRFAGSFMKSTSNSTSLCYRCFCNEHKSIYAVLEDDDFEKENTSSYMDANLEAIAEGDPETLRLLKLYQLEIDSLVQDTGKVPSKITESEWRDLLTMTSKNKRVNYIQYLWKREFQKTNQHRLRLEKRQKFEEFRANHPREIVDLSTNSPVTYGLMRNTLFQRIYPQDMRNFYNFRLLQAMQFGADIVIDCGYDDYMSRKEMASCTKQLVDTWASNRESINPFNMVFCNLSKNSVMYPKLCRILPAIEQDPVCPFNFTEKSYLDLYPKERLVYLSPNAPNLLDKYDFQTTYIIGGFVDDGNEQPLSLAKAKKDGLRVAKFPLDKHLRWRTGRKSLPLEQCWRIMNDLKDGKDWKIALSELHERQTAPFNSSPLHDGDETRVNMKTQKHTRQQSHMLQFTYEMLFKNQKSDSKK